MINNIYSNNERDQKTVSLVLGFILFLFFPYMGLSYLLCYILKINTPKTTYYKIFFLALSIFMATINSTKSLEGDYGAYWRHFESVPKVGLYGILFESWGGSGKEPLYSLIVYIGYYFTAGYFPLFTFIITLGMYYILYLAAYRFLSHLKVSNISIVAGIVSLTFFTQYFNLSAHLIRQFIAMSVVMYALALKAENGKNHYFLVLAAGLIHSSAWLIGLLSFIPWISSKMSIMRMSIFLACFSIIIIFNAVIGDFLSQQGPSSITYATERFGSTHTDTQNNISTFIMLLVLVPLSFVSIREIYFARFPSRAMCLIGHVQLFLAIFILSFYKNPLTQYRFFYYSYVFIPFLIPLLIKGKLKKISYSVIMFFFITRFFILYDKMGWKYASIFDILTYPIPYTLSIPFYKPF